MITMWWWTGFGFTTPEFTAAAIVDPLIDKSVDVYVTRFLSPKCQVGAHINRLQDKGLTAAKVAGSYIWDKHTIVKARFDDKGIVAGLLQYSPNPLITFSLFAELNSRDLKAHPNVGLSLSLLAGAASWTDWENASLSVCSLWKSYAIQISRWLFWNHLGSSCTLSKVLSHVSSGSLNVPWH